MRRNFLHRTAIAAAAFVFPIAILADISSTQNLTSGTSFSFDTGLTSGTPDVKWDGSNLTPQGSAKLYNVPGGGGSTIYNTLTQAILQQFASLGSTSPIPASSLVVGDVFAVQTNGGNFGKAMVTTVSGTTLTIQYTTYGVSGTTPGGPAITKVTNNYSYIPSGFPNSGVSPGSIITIFGSNLSDAPVGTLTLQSSAGAGLPKSLANASISVTVGGQTVTPAMYYASPAQIAAVLPSNTPTGTGTLTVTYKGTASNAFSIQVVPSALGLDTYYGTGSGLITATNATTGALFNYTSSASPGQTIVLWGSGLGADTADSDTVFTNAPHAVNTGVQVYFGGVLGTVLYAGSSGYPGLNQINVTIPSSVATGCNISVVGVIGNFVSNFGALPINQGGGTCNDPAFGLSGSQLNQLSGQSTVKSGVVLVGQLVAPGVGGAAQTSNIASAFFASTSGSAYSTSSNNSGAVSIGSCIVTQTVSTSGSTVTSTGLDAGTISLKGPLGTYSFQSAIKGSYVSLLASGAIPSTGGAFTFTGTGGADVGGFSTTVNLPNPILTWTNQSAATTITRSQGLSVAWTGGGSGTYVIITGSSTGNGVTGSYFCYAPQSAMQFNVPGYVLNTLPSGTGSTLVENATSFTTFTASGLDFGYGFGFVGASVNSTYQ